MPRAALERTGRLEITYLFFMTDDGLHHGEHRIRSEKKTPFEGSIRPPAVDCDRAGVPARAEIDALASNIDLGPTFAELASAVRRARQLCERRAGDLPTG